MIDLYLRNDSQFQMYTHTQPLSTKPNGCSLRESRVLFIFKWEYSNGENRGES